MKLIPMLALAAALCSTTVAQAESADDALMRAIYAGDTAKVTQALKRGANLNKPRPDGSLPLAWAVETQNPVLVSLLLGKGAKVNPVSEQTQSFSPLVVACQRGDPTIVAALLDAGADVNRTTSTGISPLALCAGNSTVAMVQRLLALGAKVDAADDTGQTPLMWAAAKGQGVAVKLLLDNGAELNRVTAKGFTPLFFALTSKTPDTALMLLDAGANEDYVAPDGTSLVQMAIYQQQFAVAERLIQRGADLTAYDRNGNLTRCHNCNSEEHLVARCPKCKGKGKSIELAAYAGPNGSDYTEVPVGRAFASPSPSPWDHAMGTRMNYGQDPFDTHDLIYPADPFEYCHLFL